MSVEPDANEEGKTKMEKRMTPTPALKWINLFFLNKKNIVIIYMEETRKGYFDTPQNEHDHFLLRHFPHVPLTMMRDIWEIHNSWTEEQQEDFAATADSNDWTEYNEKYNIKKIDYANYDEVLEQMSAPVMIEEIEEGGAE